MINPKHNVLTSIWTRALCVSMLGMSLGLIGCTEFSASIDGALPTSISVATPDAESGNNQNWLAWRGGAAHGVSMSETLPLHFSSQKNLHWKISIPGQGNSSPIVVDDRVFLTTATGEGHRTQLAVLSFDRETGKQHWIQQVGKPVGPTHQRNGYASATMVSDGQHVVASFGAKGLYCFTLDGQQLWHRPFPTATHEWGASSSPLIAGNVVVHLVDSQSASFLAAYDVASGQELWRTKRSSNGCWTSPIVTKVGEQWQVIVNGSGSCDGSQGFVTGYDLFNGSKEWEIKGTSDIVCPTAIVSDGLVVSSSGSNGPILAIDTATNQPKVRWESATGGPYVPTGVSYRDRIYLIDDDGNLTCLAGDDGREVWKHRLGTPVSASLIAGAGRIYVTGESGDVFVVAAADTFELLAVNSLNQRLLATPAVSNGEIFIRSQSHLYCISQETADSAPELSEALDVELSDAAISPSDVPVLQAAQ